MLKISKINKLSGLIIGCGSIGERHLFNLKNMGIQTLYVYDDDKKRSKDIASRYHVKEFNDLSTALSNNPDFSIISTPPIFHLSTATECLKYSSHIFLEKPISHEIKGISSFLKKADSQKTKVCVGYNFRFNPGLIFIKKFLSKQNPPDLISSTVGNHIKNWRPNTDFEKHYILKNGGGIILDASHEYDFIRWLLNDRVISVFCQSIKTPNLSNKTESLACIILRFKKGTIANIILDFIRPNYERETKIISENSEISWNFSVSNQSWKKYSATSRTILRYNTPRKNQIKTFNQPTNQMYELEINEFLASIINDKKPKINGWDALETLRIGMAAIRSSKNNKVIRL